jgi:hypothetical protein
LSREERKEFDLVIDEQLDYAMQMIDTLATMSDSERITYMMKEFSSATS